MKEKPKTKKELMFEVQELKSRLEEAEETLRAIRSGEVDGLVVSTPDGEQVFTLTGADYPYRVLIEEMNEGAFTMAFDGTILYCNSRFAEMIKKPLEKVINSSFFQFIEPENTGVVDAIIQGEREGRSEINLRAEDRSTVPVYFSSSFKEMGDMRAICAVVMDLTEQKRNEEILKAAKLANSILDQSTEAIIICDENGKIIQTSKEAHRYFPAKLLRQPFDSVCRLSMASPSPLQPKKFSVSSVLSGKIIRSLEVAHRRDDTKESYFLLNARPLTHKGKGVLGCVVSLTDITERKQMEESLRASEEKFRILADNTYDMESWINPQGHYVFVSPSCERITGHGPKEFMEDPGLRRNLIHPEDLPIFDKHLQEEEEVTPQEVQFRIIRPDGSIRWIGHVCQRIFDGEGRFLGIRASNRDITERKKAEKALEAARAEAENERRRLEAVMEALPVGVAITDAQGGNIRSNKAFEQLWGTPRPVALSVSDYADYKAWWPETGKPVAPEEWASAQAVQKGQTVVGQLLEIQRFDGSFAFILNSGAPIFDANGKIAGCAVAIQDITDLRKAEEALRQSEERLRLVVETSQIGIGFGDSTGRIFEANEAFFRITGYSRKEILDGGIGWECLTAPEYADIDRLVMEQVSATGVAGPYEKEYMSKSGSRIPILVSAARLSTEPDEHVAFIVDLTERKKMEEELRRSRFELEIRVKQRTVELAKANELLEKMFSSIDVSIAYMDKDFNFIRVNRAYAEAGERQPEFYVGKNHFVLFPNGENEQIFRKVVETGEPYSVYAKPFEYAEHPERGVTHWDWSLQPVKEPDGSIGGVVLSLVNVTERIRAEESVRQQAALLELAHDAIIVRDIEDRILFWNHGAEEMYGLEKSEALEKVAHDILQTEFPIQLDEIKIDLIRKGYWEGELVHTRRDRKKIIVESRWALQRGKDGNPSVILQINHDITERKRAQEAVEAERRRLNDVLEILPAYLVLLAPDYHVPFANRFFRERFGESHGKRCFEYLFGRSEPCETCESYTALKTMLPHRWEWTGPDGRIYDVSDFPFTDTDGSTLILEMGIDITERKRAQEALRAASLYTRSLIEASLDPLVTISADGKIMDVNSATELTTGVPRDELIGTDFSDYFTEPEKTREGYQQVFREGFVRDYPLAIRHVSGKVTDVLYHATVYKNEVGEIHGVFAAARDITERKRMEEELRKSENRLRLLSSQLLTVQEAERKRIAREIHDSIGQTLAAIKFGLESKLSQMGTRTPPPGVSIENIISLAQNGIEESRRIQMDLRPSVLDDIGILATIGWFTREFQKVYSHISVEKQISAEEDEIPDSLKTALFRVMQEAMNNVAKHSKADLVRLILKKTADKIELSIKDNGAGFDLESIRQGLGLTSMRERTELSGGTFGVESIPGKGTIIRARWPI